MSSDQDPDRLQRAPSSANLTPPTNRRLVMVGVAVPVSAVLAWILVHALHSALWYALVPIVALGCGALYAVSNISQGSQRDRGR